MAEHSGTQPVGALPFPTGLLLVDPTASNADAVMQTLVAGGLPVAWPEDLRGHELAHAGDLDGAATAFSARVETSPVDRYNHYVLAPDGVDAEAVRAALPEHLQPMVDVVRYTLGETETVPAVTSTAREIEAVLVATRATAALSAGDPAGAVDLLVAAAEGVAEVAQPLSAVLLGNAGTIAHEHGLGHEQAADHLRTACLGLAETTLDGVRGDLHLHLGLLLHEMAADGRVPLKRAVDQYYTALQLVSRSSAPYTWAMANMNLGTAYLTMPMVEATDQLRAGIAMQALRAALEVFTREEHPVEWASAQVNLANSLVYTPSTHQGDNIVEAVERYEEVLATRDRNVDPIGRARLLANLGNALAHLGIFDHAKSKLFEARSLFEEHLDHDSAMMVRSVLDEISRQTVPDGPPRQALPARPSAADRDRIRATSSDPLPEEVGS